MGRAPSLAGLRWVLPKPPIVPHYFFLNGGKKGPKFPTQKGLHECSLEDDIINERSDPITSKLILYDRDRVSTVLLLLSALLLLSFLILYIY